MGYTAGVFEKLESQKTQDNYCFGVDKNTGMLYYTINKVDMGKTIVSADGKFEWDEEKNVMNLRKAKLREVQWYHEQYRNLAR